MRVDLYAYFSAAMGCLESDLRAGGRVQWNADVVRAAPEDAAPAHWSDFAAYVCGSAPAFKNAEEAKRYIIARKCG